jgi:hypothetical protein
VLVPRARSSYSRVPPPVVLSSPFAYERSELAFVSGTRTSKRFEGTSERTAAAKSEKNCAKLLYV